MPADYENKYGKPGDTIVAAATPPGKSAVAVVRVSGPATIETVRGLFTAGNENPDFPPPDRRMTLGIISDPKNGRHIDQVLIVFFKSPNSYTGEDLIELHCHGGPVVVREVVSLLIDQGARPALPGEFTLRAFSNGRMDLTRAESVNDIIESKNRQFLDASVRRLGGALEDPVKNLRNKLVELLASIEVAIDYPDDETPQVSPDNIRSVLSEVREELQRLVQHSDSARITNEGIKVAVIGLPNSGKSSLVNRILGRERVIVSDIPGTTRDLVGDWTFAGGIDFFLMDTAGITDSSDPIEREGVKRTVDYIGKADIVIALFDGSVSWKDGNDKIVSAARKATKAIPVISKCDLEEAINISNIEEILPGPRPVRTSSVDGTGIKELMDVLVDSVSDTVSTDLTDAVFLNLRHRNLIEDTINHLSDGISNAGSVPDDILTIDIRSSVELMGEITGESATDDILSTIFANFCVGK